MTFEQKIKDWVIVDNKIKRLNSQVKEYRNEKKNITKSIYENNNNNIKNIKITDGQLKFVNTKINNALSYKFIQECLNNCLDDENKIKKIMNYIKKNREFKYVEEIKRY